MNSIFASKLYICSSRQDKIKAALTNPINAELVSQIADYLDDEELRKLTDRSDKKEESANTDKEDKKKDREEPDSEGESIHFTPNPKSFPSSERDIEEKEESDIEDKEVEETKDKEDKEDIVESNTYIDPSSIFINNISGDVNSIKGILNMNDDTKGVTRVNIKNDEMWIYYEDSINLNNIMTLVIELLNASNYFYLEFNRLARSDNAIVFQISMEDTNSDMKPMEGE